MDAVFRLTRKLPFHFDNSPRASKLLVPTGLYSPYNAQATVHMHSAFWGLFLPFTVPGRVTDIWRSYFTQRFLHELNLALIYAPPLVTHTRTPHNYIADLQAGNDLYMKTAKLLEFLSGWGLAYNLGGDKGQETYRQLLRSGGHKDAADAWSTWLAGSPLAPARPNHTVLKLIVMVKNEWPLVKQWVLYHGKLIGFENLYIVDGSTDFQCVSFLTDVRDRLGVNVIFAPANLNELEG